MNNLPHSVQVLECRLVYCWWISMSVAWLLSCLFFCSLCRLATHHAFSAFESMVGRYHDPASISVTQLFISHHYRPIPLESPYDAISHLNWPRIDLLFFISAPVVASHSCCFARNRYTSRSRCVACRRTWFLDPLGRSLFYSSLIKLKTP